MPLWKTEAILLQSRRWGEADRLVTLYTLKMGKVRGVARRARRMNSPFGGGLEPFGYVEVTVFDKGYDPLARINHVNVRQSFFGLRESLEQLSAAARMCNVVSALTADRDPGPHVFSTLLDGLRALEEGYDPRLMTLIVQIRLLGYSGFRPQMDHCVVCGRVDELADVRFSAATGGLVCRDCDGSREGTNLPISPGSVAFIQQARRLSFPTAIRLQATGQVRWEVDAVLETYVKAVVGRSLPSMDCLAIKSPCVGYGQSYER